MYNIHIILLRKIPLNSKWIRSVRIMFHLLHTCLMRVSLDGIGGGSSLVKCSTNDDDLFAYRNAGIVRQAHRGGGEVVREE
ncbi:hypothetical protein T4B_2552 [Trichinella pseudospiralis]|uniref:Uncharacterized protein n=1 Tax=Trichinella pseudospiralis TaxID=6337 RepID=A0A0V1I0Y4_TRIPS|nr:hypothetical protein T4B_2552 [Trichinella pseudospiralis]